MAINRFLRHSYRLPCVETITKHLSSHHQSSYLDQKVITSVAKVLGGQRVTREKIGDKVLGAIPTMSHDNASNAYTAVLFVLDDMKPKK